MSKSAEYQRFCESFIKIDEANTFGYMLSKYKLQRFRHAMIEMNRTSNSELKKMKVSDLKARENWGVVGFIYNGKPSGFVYDPNGYPPAWNLLIDGELRNTGYSGSRMYKSWKSVREELLEMLGPDGEIEVLDRGEDRIKNKIMGNPESPRNAADAKRTAETTKLYSIINALYDSIRERMKLGFSPEEAFKTTREDTKPYGSIYSALFNSELEANIIKHLSNNDYYYIRDDLKDALSGKIIDADIRKLANQNIKINPDLLKRLQNFRANTAEANAKKVYSNICLKLKDFLDLDYCSSRIAKIGSKGYYPGEVLKIDTNKLKTMADLARFYSIIAREWPNTKIVVNSLYSRNSETSKGISLAFVNLPSHFYLNFDKNGNFMSSELE